MGLVKVLALAFVLAACYCKWGEKIVLEDASSALYSHLSFIDSTKKVHTLTSVRNNTYKLMYVGLAADGKINTYVFENFDGYYTDYAGSITGTSNGKDLYIAMTFERENRIYDVYFSESSDNGLTWSEPIVARSDELDDESRMFPKIERLHTGQLVIFYQRYSIHLYFATRLPGKKEWEAEVQITLEKCPRIEGVRAISTAIVDADGKEETLLFEMKCHYQKGLIILGETNDAGKSWKMYSKNFTSSYSSVPALLSGIPGKNVLYGALDTTEGRSIIYHYLLGGVFEKLMAVPAIYTNFLSLVVFERKGIKQLVYIAGSSTYTPKYSVKLWHVLLDGSWKIKTIEAPQYGSSSGNVKLYYSNDQLLAVGIGDYKTLALIKYTFDEDGMLSSS